MAGMPFPKSPKIQHAPSMRGSHPGTSFAAPMRGFTAGLGAGSGGGNPFHYLAQAPPVPRTGQPTGSPQAMSRGGQAVGGNYAARGGHVPGKGNKDTVPAMLTPGEFVVRKKAAERHKPLLEKINRSDGDPVGYHDGGEVHQTKEPPKYGHKKEQTESHRQHEQRGEYAKGGTVTIGPEKKGQKSLHFQKGALHRQLGVPEGEKIPASKKKAALSGSLGPLAKKRANFAFKGALAAGRKTARGG